MAVLCLDNFVAYLGSPPEPLDAGPRQHDTYSQPAVVLCLVRVTERSTVDLA